MLIVARSNRLQIKSNRNESKQFGADTIVMQNQSINTATRFLANRSFAQVECNQNPNENIDSIQNRVVPGKSKSTGLF
jgi:hypothetical protein